jgi:hypothetical protein
MMQKLYQHAGNQNQLRIRHLADFIACFRYALKWAATAATSD